MYVFLLYFSITSTSEAAPFMFFSVLSRGRVSFIIKQKEIHVFLSFCGFEDTTDAMRGKRYQKPCTFTIIYYIILKN